MEEIEYRLHQGEELQVTDDSVRYTLCYFGGSYYLQVANGLPLAYGSLDEALAELLRHIGNWYPRSLI